MNGNIFNSKGVHVGVVTGAAVFGLKGQKLYDLKGSNIYKLNGDLVFCPGNSLTKSREFLEDGVSGGSPHEGT